MLPGPAGLQSEGTGTLTLTGGTSSYTGATTINNGVVNIRDNLQLHRNGCVDTNPHASTLGITNNSGAAQSFAGTLTNINIGASQTWDAGSVRREAAMLFRQAPSVSGASRTLTIDGANDTNDYWRRKRDGHEWDY